MEQQNKYEKSLKDGEYSRIDKSEAILHLEHQNKYQQRLKDGEYSRIEKSLLIAARHNHKRKMTALIRAIKDARLDLLHHFPSTANLLHTAVSFTDSGYETVEVLLKEYPKLVTQVDSSRQQSALHVAVARRDRQAVKLLLEAFGSVQETSDLYPQKTTIINMPHKMSDKYVDTCIEAELPLSMAAWNADKQIIDLLVKHGARIEECNSAGNNVFHCLIQEAAKPQCKTNELRLQALLSTFQQLIKTVEHTVRCQNPPCEHHQDQYHKDTPELNQRDPNERELHFNKSEHAHNRFISCMYNQRNKGGYTPLCLASRLNSGHMFDLIINTMNVYKFLDDVDVIANVFLYDITEIDSAICDNDGRSVLELIIANSSNHMEDYFDFTEKSPVIELIRLKWDRYRYIYWGWGVLHALFITIFSVCALGPRATPVEEAPPTLYFMTGPGIFQLLFVLYAVAMLGIEFIYMIAYKRRLPDFLNPVGSGSYRLILVLLSIFSVIWLIVRLSISDYEQVPLSGCIILGWLFLVYFLRGIKQFSYFTTTLQTVITGDMMRFVIIYLIVLFAFSFAVTVTFGRETDHSELSQFDLTLLYMYKLTLGLVDLQSIASSQQPVLAGALLISFLTTANILLINMLIALLNDTFSHVASQKESHWHLQKLSIVLHLEDMLPRQLKKVCGERKQAQLFTEEDKKTWRHYLPVKSLQPQCRQAELLKNREELLATWQAPALAHTSPDDLNDSLNTAQGRSIMQDWPAAASYSHMYRAEASEAFQHTSTAAMKPTLPVLKGRRNHKATKLSYSKRSQRTAVVPIF